MILLWLACASPGDSAATCQALGRVSGTVTMLGEPVGSPRITVFVDSDRYEVLGDADGAFSTSGLGELTLAPADNGGTCQGPEVAVDLGPCDDVEVDLEIDPDTCVDGR